jgi:hypothetical protein
MALKEWERNTTKGLSKFTQVWQRKDGMVGGINNNTKYPFIAVTFEGNGFNVRVITWSETKELANLKSKSEAIKYAKSYMRSH